MNIDDIATPMEMMMEDTGGTKNATFQQSNPFSTPAKEEPTDAPSSPVVRGIMRLSQLMSKGNNDSDMNPMNNPEEDDSLLASLIANNTESPQRTGFDSGSFNPSSNPITPSPRNSSYSARRRRRRSSHSKRKPTVPLNISLANRPTKAWLARHGQLPGQKDAQAPPAWNNVNGNKRSGESLPLSNESTKRRKKWHGHTVPLESVPNRPTQSWLAKVEASRAIQNKLEQKRQQGLTRFDAASCPYFQSIQTLQTPNGQFFHYGDHQYP